MLYMPPMAAGESAAYRLRLRVHLTIEELAFSEWRPLTMLRRPLWKWLYGIACSKTLVEDPMSFLNLGYLDRPDGFQGTGVDTSDRLAARLYDRVLGAAELTGRTVVEVGCGSGAGSAHIAGTRAPASLVGVDLSDKLVAWGTQHYGAPNLRFVQGDAQHLPFAGDSVDAVVNVESSHCYPSRPRFFGEVARVLRPGGSFLFADLVFTRGGSCSLEHISAQLGEAGLEIEEHSDITANVIAARDAVSQSSFRPRFAAGKSPFDVMRQEDANFLAGTKNYRQLVAREIRYGQWRAVKPR